MIIPRYQKLLLLLFTFSLFVPKPIHALSCAEPPSVPDAYSDAHFVFEGTSKMSQFDEYDFIVSTQFDVHQSWKGSINEIEQTVFEGLNFWHAIEDGDRYIVYADTTKDVHQEELITIPLCNRTILVTNDFGAAEIEELNQITTAEVKQATPMPSNENTPSTTLDYLNIALWGAQIILALAFAMAGVMKLAKTKEQLQNKMHWVENFSSAEINTIGLLELLGAIGIVTPALIQMHQWITVTAASGLMFVMFGAAITHIKRKEFSMVMTNLLLFALAAFVAFGRYFLYPFG